MEAGEKSEDTAPTRDETENPKLSDLVKGTIGTDKKGNNDEKSDGDVPNRNLAIDIETENSKKSDGLSEDDQQPDHSIQPQVAIIEVSKQEQIESKESNEPERDDPKEQSGVKMVEEKSEENEKDSNTAKEEPCVKMGKEEKPEENESESKDSNNAKEEPCVKMAEKKPEGMQSESTRKDEGMSIVDRIKNKVLFSTFSHLLIICPFFNFLLSYFFVQYIRQQITSLSCCFELSRSFPSILISINNICLLDI